MDKLIEKRIKPQDKIYFLSEITNIPVYLKNKRIGKLIDFVVEDKGVVAEVTHICVARPFGDPTLFIPWKKVTEISTKSLIVDIEAVSEYVKALGEDKIRLRDYILDKKVLDVEDKEVEVVYDVTMKLKNNRFYVIGVDMSKYGLLRRMGMKWLADFIYKVAEKIGSEIVGWSYVEPLPEEIGSFKGNLKLKVLKEELEDMQPVDLANIIEGMDHEQRMLIFGELETSEASDTLEEMDPKVQRDVIADLKKEKTAVLISEMTPGQAADILSVLPWNDAEEILKLLKGENVEKIKSILAKQEQVILDFATSNFLSYSPDETVKNAKDTFQEKAKGKEAITYLYIVNENNKLLGVLNLKELLMSEEDTKLSDIMTTKVISLSPSTKLIEASELFSKYNFRALPVAVDKEVMVGVITYRDIVNLKHHYLE